MNFTGNFFFLFFWLIGRILFWYELSPLFSFSDYDYNFLYMGYIKYNDDGILVYIRYNNDDGKFFGTMVLQY